MAQTTRTADDTAVGAATFRLMGRAFAVLRIFTGLVFLSNAIAKATGAESADLGFFSFTLVTRDGAKSIASGAAERTYIAPLGAFYRDVVLPNWGFFGVFLTIAELAIGLGLITGVATRLAAVGGLLPIAPIWVLLWHTGLYLWEYPAEDLLPLALLATVPADVSPASTPASPPASTTGGPSNASRDTATRRGQAPRIEADRVQWRAHPGPTALRLTGRAGQTKAARAHPPRRCRRKVPGDRRCGGHPSHTGRTAFP